MPPRAHRFPIIWLCVPIAFVLLESVSAASSVRKDPPEPINPCDEVRDFVPSGTRAPDDCGAASGLQSASNGTIFWGPSDANQPFRSCCWYGYTHAVTAFETYSPVVLQQGTPFGFRMKFGLLGTPGLGDLLSPAQNIGSDSLALLPPGAAEHGTAWHGVGRPTLHGLVDLVSGAPLAKVTDLEVPFGGATFRLIRTRSSSIQWQGLHWAYRIPAQDAWWDWTGSGWMASENPLLLIDSALPDSVGDHPRTCWLVLDAHRSIPFQLIENDGRYEAPPRFRARMDHNGSGWSATNASWEHPPTHFIIDLYDGEVRYTFVTVREDVPENKWDRKAILDDTYGQPLVTSSYHDRPFTPRQFELAGRERPGHNPYSHLGNPGLGIPYYGLCIRIEDRYGHAVEIEYCDSPRAAMDDPMSECLECRQGCLAKGQIKSVRLKAQGQTRWTLLYVHRMFKGLMFNAAPGKLLAFIAEQFGSESEANAPVWELHGDIAIDRIYVFEGDPWSGAGTPCLTVNHYEEPGLHGGAEPLEAYNSQHGTGSIPTNWKQSVRYHYGHSPMDANRSIPHLVRTTVTTSRAEQGLEPHSTYTVFVYPEMSRSALLDDSLPWLEAVFKEEDIARLLREQRGNPLIPEWLDADSVALWRDPNSATQGFAAELSALVLRYASVRWGRPALSINGLNGLWPEFPSSQAPTTVSLYNGQYLTPAHPAANLYSDRQDGAPWLLVVQSGMERKQYKINRIVACPSAGESGLLSKRLSADAQRAPHRGLLHHPFGWRAFDVAGHAVGPEPASLHEPRWIAIIDEFATYEQITDVYNDYDPDSGVCEGLTSRRVVEMSPSGYVLRERTWTSLNGETVVSGGGLGVQHIYATVEKHFEFVVRNPLGCSSLSRRRTPRSRVCPVEIHTTRCRRVASH